AAQRLHFVAARSTARGRCADLRSCGGFPRAGWSPAPGTTISAVELTRLCGIPHGRNHSAVWRAGASLLSPQLRPTQFLARSASVKRTPNQFVVAASGALPEVIRAVEEGKRQPDTRGDRSEQTQSEPTHKTRACWTQREATLLRFREASGQIGRRA